MLITLPDGSTTVPGTVAAVAPVTTSQPQSSQGQGQGQGTPAAMLPVTIRPDLARGSLLAANYNQAQVQVTSARAAGWLLVAVPL